MKKLSKLVSLMLSVVLCIGMAAPAFAIEYDIATGKVHVENDDAGNAVSWQENHKEHGSKDNASTDKDIIITGNYKETDKDATGSVIDVGENVKNTTITLQGVTIDTSETRGEWNATIGDWEDGKAALSIGKDSEVTIDPEGTNSLKSGCQRAGLELNGGASVTIQVDNEDSLTATGGYDAAGIGTGGNIDGTAGGDINISTSDGGTVTAIGGNRGAGIGAGCYGTVGNINISGSGTVDAIGGWWGAGIGAGQISAVDNINISGSGTVTATGGFYAAGIGAGDIGSTVENITICCGAKVTATGSAYGGVDIGAGNNGKVGTIINPGGSHNYQTVTEPATCTEKGVTTYTCSKCNHTYAEEIELADHTPGEAAPENVIEAQPGVEGSYDLVVRCTVCGDVISSEHVTTSALPVPAIPDDGADAADTAPSATIADQEVPLAGLTPLYMLLEELRQYEEIPEIELPEDFKWIDHAYAQAIYWGLQEELVVDTEEGPLDPDEVITVAILRNVLTNFAAYKGANFVVTVEGEDDEIVFDLGERLTAFYAELEAALKAQEDKAA